MSSFRGLETPLLHPSFYYLETEREFQCEMPVTFGSVGDILSVSFLIRDLILALNDSRGSSAEYQAVVLELESINHALSQVEGTFRSYAHFQGLTDLKLVADKSTEQFKEVIAKFQERIKPYHDSLGHDTSITSIRATANKVRWQVSEKEYLARFRTELRTHNSSINTLLGVLDV